jgi:hypothetical protein
LTRLRRITGIEVVSEPSELTRIEPAESPGADGVFSWIVTVWLFPGRRMVRAGETEPN